MVEKHRRILFDIEMYAIGVIVYDSLACFTVKMHTSGCSRYKINQYKIIKKIFASVAIYPKFVDV